MYSSQSEFREFYLMFMTSDHWLFKHLKKGFGHCVVLVNDGYNWICFDPSIYQPRIKILNLLPTQKLAEVEGFKHFAKLRVVMSERKSGIMPRLTCVSKAKDLIGLKGCWSLTPWRLFSWLANLKIQNYDLHNIVGMEVLKWVE